MTDFSTSTKLQQPSVHHWFKQKIQSLSIRQQIYLGYSLTLAIAIFGTATGLSIGNQYQKPAYERMVLAHHQERLLSDLRIINLEIPLYLQKLKNSQNKTLEEFEQEKILWLAEIEKITDHLSELESSDYDRGSKVYSILEQYHEVIEAYTQEITMIAQQIEALGVTPGELTAAEELLLNFLEKPIVKKFTRLSEQSKSLILTVHDREIDAEVSLNQAKTVSEQIIFISLLISVILATGLAIYTSRAIARPLEEVTKVAQQVTSQSNFNLQIPITKYDEIGSLSMSLNQLIFSVNQLLKRLEQEKETQLIQSEKMASLGRMLAGVAHELNNPINFIYGNIAPAKEYIQDIFSLLETYATEIPHPPEAIEELTESIELDFLQEDLIKIMQSMQLGAERARSIVLSLKNFSRLDDDSAHSIDLHECIDSTLIMLHNRIKQKITIVKNYGDVPEIEGYMGLLYQVFMNLLSNAIDALEEQGKLNHQPKIIITTELHSDPAYVMINIADNGAGIDSENQNKIFETFFTTKPRGVGTGLGLAITRQIVEEKHSGKLNCHSELGEGTEFSIILPIKYQIAGNSSENSNTL